MGKIALMAVLFVGIIVGGIAVQAGVFDDAPGADALCDRELDGDGWAANLTASSSLDDGTRLVCERDDRTANVTVNVQIEVDGA